MLTACRLGLRSRESHDAGARRLLCRELAEGGIVGGKITVVVLCTLVCTVLCRRQQRASGGKREPLSARGDPQSGYQVRPDLHGAATSMDNALPASTRGFGCVIASSVWFSVLGFSLTWLSGAWNQRPRSRLCPFLERAVPAFQPSLAHRTSYLHLSARGCIQTGAAKNPVLCLSIAKIERSKTRRGNGKSHLESCGLERFARQVPSGWIVVGTFDFQRFVGSANIALMSSACT